MKAANAFRRHAKGAGLVFLSLGSMPQKWKIAGPTMSRSESRASRCLQKRQPRAPYGDADRSRAQEREEGSGEKGGAVPTKILRRRMSVAPEVARLQMPCQ